MGGRGTFAAGKNIPYVYQTVDNIEGVKVLEGINGKHGLPEEAHSSNAYIKLKPDGTFHEMRIYDEEHYLVKEIAYHPEPMLNSGNRSENVLHIHEYKRDNFKDRTPRLMTDMEIEKYKKYLKGVKFK
jgi:hypothetical protein